MDKVKDGYLKAIDWIEDHPHLTLWSAAGAIVVALAL